MNEDQDIIDAPDDGIVEAEYVDVDEEAEDVKPERVTVDENEEEYRPRPKT